MKKLILGLAMSLASVTQIYSQVKSSKDVSYTISDPYKVIDGYKNYFSKDGEILTIKFSKGKYIFQKFKGDKLNIAKVNEIPNTVEGISEGFIKAKDQFYYFYSTWDKVNKITELFAREVDFEGAKFAGEGQRVVKVNGKLAYTSFSITTSFDESKIMIRYRKVPEIKNDNVNKDVIGMIVLDKDLSKIWGGESKMPYTEKKMNNLDFAVNSEGAAYLLTEVYRDETTKRYTKSGEPNFDIELLKFTSDNECEKIKIKSQDKFIYGLSFFEGKDFELNIAGFYSNDKRAGANGFFLAKMKNDEVVDYNFYDVPANVLKLYLSDKKQEKLEQAEENGADLKMHSMYMRDIVYDSKGNITLYAERYFVVSRTDPKTGSTTYTYYYQEIIGAGISNDGELLWMTKLPKNQVGSSQRGGMGFVTISSKGHDYLLFIDNIRNIELPLNQWPKGHRDGKGGYLTGFKINRETGETEKFSVFNLNDVNGIALYQFNTGRIIKLDDDSFAVECYKKKKEDVMVKVELK